jgi:hypothetical protein
MSLAKKGRSRPKEIMEKCHMAHRGMKRSFYTRLKIVMGQRRTAIQQLSDIIGEII